MTKFCKWFGHRMHWYRSGRFSRMGINWRSKCIWCGMELDYSYGVEKPEKYTEKIR